MRAEEGGSAHSTSKDPDLDEDAIAVRNRVIARLEEQGFAVSDGQVVPPVCSTKARIRELHRVAVEHRRARAAKSLRRHETSLLSRIADGSEIREPRIEPILVPVERGTQNELLFRYASLHWSIPVSSGYGRRLRLLVIDQITGKLVGLIGLCDPIINLRARDAWVGWSSAERSLRLRHVVDAFVLGAVPPYSLLLGGKLVAMLASANEVRHTFEEKYKGRGAVISGREHSGSIAMLTTTSALGRSSLYNRLKFRGRLLYQSVGKTAGSGEFHFANGLYSDLRKFAEQRAEATAKSSSWGKGFRNRREVVKKCLPLLGLSWRAVYHGVEREAFVVPLAENTQAFLKGYHHQLLPHDMTTDALAAEFHARWLLPRADRLNQAREWSRESWRLW